MKNDMGPRDPFGNSKPAGKRVRPQREPREKPPSSADTSPPQQPSRQKVVGLGGLFAGVFFGLCVLGGYVLEALFLLLCGGLGAGGALVAYGLWTHQLDARAAWRALWGRR